MAITENHGNTSGILDITASTANTVEALATGNFIGATESGINTTTAAASLAKPAGALARGALPIAMLAAGFAATSNTHYALKRAMQKGDKATADAIRRENHAGGIANKFGDNAGNVAATLYAGGNAFVNTGANTVTGGVAGKVMDSTVKGVKKAIKQVKDAHSATDLLTLATHWQDPLRNPVTQEIWNGSVPGQAVASLDEARATGYTAKVNAAIQQSNAHLVGVTAKTNPTLTTAVVATAATVTKVAETAAGAYTAFCKAADVIEDHLKLREPKGAANIPLPKDMSYYHLAGVLPPDRKSPSPENVAKADAVLATLNKPNRQQDYAQLAAFAKKPKRPVLPVKPADPQVTETKPAQAPVTATVTATVPAVAPTPPSAAKQTAQAQPPKSPHMPQPGMAG
ncbi:MAG: hypothetical protein EB059_05970 [Alphaproteobacteria bacterium]|nr:hypothetical protein [Alphaproteobacteria bacterium]